MGRLVRMYQSVKALPVDVIGMYDWITGVGKMLTYNFILAIFKVVDVCRISSLLTRL